MHLPGAWSARKAAWSGSGRCFCSGATRGQERAERSARAPDEPTDPFPDVERINLLPFGVFTGDLLDEIDDATPQLGIGNAHKRFGQ